MLTGRASKANEPPFFLFRGCQAVSGTGSHACGGKARMTVLVRMDVCTSWSTRFFRFSGHCLFASQANGCIQTCPSCSLTSGSTKNTSPGQLAVPYRSFRYLQPQASLGSYRHAKVCLVATLGYFFGASCRMARMVFIKQLRKAMRHVCAFYSVVFGQSSNILFRMACQSYSYSNLLWTNIS